MIIVDVKVRNKSRTMSREQSEEEDGVVGTEVGPESNENVETEVEFRPPRGTNRMPDERPIITGAVGEEAGEHDPGQTNLFGCLGGAKPKRPKFEVPIPRTPGPCRMPPGTGKQPEESGMTDFHLKCRPQCIRDPVGSQPVPGQGWLTTGTHLEYRLRQIRDWPGVHQVPGHSR